MDFAIPKISLHAFSTTKGMANDAYYWSTESTSAGSFSSSKAWETLKPRSDSKAWASTVWFKGAVPKHAFNMWITTLDRLPTKKRLADWGMNIQTHCCLCSIELETRDHLLLSCQFAVEIQNQVFIRIGRPTTQFRSLSDLLRWIHGPHTNQIKLFRLLSSQAVVYSIWKRRNNMLHNQTSVPPLFIFREIDRNVRNIIHARKCRRRFRKLIECWLIQLRIIYQKAA